MVCWIVKAFHEIGMLLNLNNSIHVCADARQPKLMKNAVKAMDSFASAIRDRFTSREPDYGFEVDW